MDKFIIITSIFPPTLAVQKLVEISDWQVIVVGDKKTPCDWSYPGVIYLSLDKQASLGFKIAKVLPFNHYARKNIGYLFAMQQGAKWIADLDDDNIPNNRWSDFTFSDYANLDILTSPRFPNIYKYFTDQYIWPRGFPLDEILDSPALEFDQAQNNHIGIWQFLANQDADVDAIYRLIINKPIIFNQREPIQLARGVYSPFNSQNTIWNKAAFCFLMLPAYVNFRFTDILRGYVAQRCLWLNQLYLAFGPATVYQERNPHNFLADFQSEIPVYLNIKKITYLLDNISNQGSPGDLLVKCYELLHKEGFVTENELAMCHAWVYDFEKVVQHG